MLERGAVEGEIFHRGAVQALAPEEIQVTPRLAALVRKELIRPDQAAVPGEDGFRFRHLLIRDAAYDALPKAVRAELHERFADWLEQRGAELVELDEILGYHLEQAARYKAELGQAGHRAGGASGRAARSSRPPRALAWGRARRCGTARTRPRAYPAVAARRRPRARSRGSALPRPSRSRGDRQNGRGAGTRRPTTSQGRRSLVRRRRSTARGLRPIRTSTSWSDSRARRCRYSSRSAITLGSCTSGRRSVSGSPTSAAGGTTGRRQPSKHAGTPGLPGNPLLDNMAASSQSPAVRCPQTRRWRCSILSFPRVPHPAALLVRAWLLGMLGRFEEASLIEREASNRLRELTGVNWVEWLPAEIAILAGRPRGRRPPPTPVVRSARGARPTLLPIFESHRCWAVSSARSDATTRPSAGHSAGASSTFDRTL